MRGSWALGLLSACVPAAPSAGRAPESSEVFSLTLPDQSDAESVVRIRELPMLSPLNVETVARSELVRVALTQVDEEAPPPVLTERGRILAALGLVNDDFELRSELGELLEETLVGLYDPRTGRVLVADDAATQDGRPGHVHELAHALVDQHFDLGSRLRHEPDGTDRAAARAALAEGDANSVMFEFMSRGSVAARNELVRSFLSAVEAEGDAAPVLKRLLTAPYVDGLVFVERLRREGGWARVNEVWRDPPTTSEQLLHPDAHARRELARALAHPAPPGPRCREVYSDVLGEQTLRCFLAEWVGEAAAAKAVTGWAGDRVTTFDCPDGHWVNIRLAVDQSATLPRLLEAFAEGGSWSRCLGRGWGSLGAGATEAELVYPPGSACAEVRALGP